MDREEISRLFEEAEARGAALAGFNFQCMVDLQGICRAAEAARAPILVMATDTAVRFAGVEYLAALGKAAAANTSVPVVLHLDHTSDFGAVMRAIRCGFDSVMFDGSALPFAENVRLTRRVVEVAHSVGVWVEGELGRLVGKEDDLEVDETEAALTDPEAAARFATETGVDALAVAIGSAHGWYKKRPKLDFERLQAIRQLVGRHLVLHGGTGIPDEDIRRAIELGIRKVNVGTELRTAFARTAYEVLNDDPVRDDWRPALDAARNAVQEAAFRKLGLLGW